MTTVPWFTCPRREWVVLEHPEGYAIGPYPALTMGDLSALVQTFDTKAEAVAWVESSYSMEDIP